MASRSDDIIVTREFFNYLLEVPFTAPKEYFERRDRLIEEGCKDMKVIASNGFESTIECTGLDDEAIHAIFRKIDKEEEAKQKETLNVF